MTREEAVGAAGVDPRIAAVVAEGASGRTAADNEDMLSPETVIGLSLLASGLLLLGFAAAVPPAARGAGRV